MKTKTPFLVLFGALLVGGVGGCASVSPQPGSYSGGALAYASPGYAAFDDFDYADIGYFDGDVWYWDGGYGWSYMGDPYWWRTHHRPIGASGEWLRHHHPPMNGRPPSGSGYYVFRHDGSVLAARDGNNFRAVGRVATNGTFQQTAPRVSGSAGTGWAGVHGRTGGTTGRPAGSAPGTWQGRGSEHPRTVVNGTQHSPAVANGSTGGGAFRGFHPGSSPAPHGSSSPHMGSSGGGGGGFHGGGGGGFSGGGHSFGGGGGHSSGGGGGGGGGGHSGGGGGGGGGSRQR